MGKILKTSAMIQSPLVRKHIPLTRWLNEETLTDMLKKHYTVFIKPDKGSGGYGIIRVRKTSKNLFEVIMGTKRQLVPQENLMKYIQNFTRPFRSYLVQQGIKLSQYKGRPFDFRIYMQKPRNSWVVSGKVTRVAAPGRFLTNYHQGAKPVTVPEVLRSVLNNNKKVAEMIQQIGQLSLATAQVLDAHFPGIRELGIDIALEKSGKLWILEANTSPACITFRLLPDKTMYHRILMNRRYIYNAYV
ncbi:YheC/YheD family protein [Polycladomyces subterraneus]|uniref:YheC/YheD family protein n=1 Tax=Polycladomyces subterraneus TaxID=1016997 RepID=A0ABT8IK92_9BACL|nr:YheC/YheD family protein [Polycladomyces subterraneus]MDN4593198.1 YheC/YheD family protein [Polycladomyces subterraneus]